MVANTKVIQSALKKRKRELIGEISDFDVFGMLVRANRIWEKAVELQENSLKVSIHTENSKVNDGTNLCKSVFSYKPWICLL